MNEWQESQINLSIQTKREIENKSQDKLVGYRAHVEFDNR